MTNIAKKKDSIIYESKFLMLIVFPKTYLTILTLLKKNKGQMTRTPNLGQLFLLSTNKGRLL